MSSAPASFGSRVESLAIRLTGRASFWVALVLLLGGFQVVRAVNAVIPEPPKVLTELPAFALTDQTGRAYGSKELAGRIYVADFVFTSCPTLCPTLTKQLQKVRHRLRNMGDSVHLVSFSVDPERDTPPKLAEYAKKYGANAETWSFLTGSTEAIQAAVVKGFKMPMDLGDTKPGEAPDPFAITHGSKFVLVDPEGRVRGYYDSDEAGVDALVRDVGLLAAAVMLKRPS